MKKQSAAMRFLEGLDGPLTFANSLEAIRVGDNITQAEFARKLGVSRQHLCDIEKGRRLPSIERAAKWAELLGYSAPQFVRLVLQGEIQRANLDMRVDVSAA